jgi:pilus assembly protein CpaE
MRAILICPDAELRANFESVAHLYPLRVMKTIDRYPDEEQLRRLVRMWAPTVIFCSLEDMDQVIELTNVLDAEFGSIPRVGLSNVEEPRVLRLALQLRMMELIVPPFDEDRFARLLRRLTEHLRLNPSTHGSPGQLYAFMPAKGGVGASTIASNAARAFAEEPNSTVLLADFDLSSGMTGFLFNAQHDYSINDAVVRNKELDDESWKRLVKRVGNVDLLLSGAPRFDEGLAPEQVPPLLEYVRRSYSVVAADIAATFDERSLSVLREANRIFLVTTPDLSSLRAAKLKVMFLRKLEWEDKTRLLVNRVAKKMELTLDEIEKTVGLPVYASFPCDYADVTRSIKRAESSPKLAASIKQFVDKVSEKKARETMRVRFIERFAMPGRYGLR